MIVINPVRAIGYFGATKEPEYRLLRDLRDVQLCESYRGADIETWLLPQSETLALSEKIASIRLDMFKSNPAIELYQRQIHLVVSQEGALFWMERRLGL